MTLFETIRLIKNYEEQTKNYLLYMQNINHTLMNNMLYVDEIKIQLVQDLRLKNRLIALGNSSNGIIIQDLFPVLFEKENKKTR